MNRKVLLIVSGAIFFGVAVGLVFFFIKTRTPTQRGEPSSTSVTEVIEQRSSYAIYTREEMIDKSAAIFVGKVTDISSTQWNQDSGEYWADGFQYHTIGLEVVRPIVDTIGAGKEMILTVLGVSPLDGNADHSLKIGDQGVFFIRKTELAWRGGTRSILELIGVPTDSYFLREKDDLYYGRFNEQPFTLPQLIEKISQIREIRTNEP